MLQKHIRALVPFVLALFAALPAFGNTLTVTNTSDSGPGSLRAAIAAASPGDTIDFSLTYPATIVLANTLSIDTSLTISGPGASNLAISGNNAVRVLYVYQGVTVNISGVTIENGHSSIGGGIYNFYGTLTLTNSRVSDNSATSGGAGGLLNYSGTVALINSTVSGNSAPASGGGVYSFNGTLTLSNSTVSGNIAYQGGGILNSYADLRLINSTVSGNNASYNNGGGVYNYQGALTLTSSTVSGNSAAYSGGGVYSYYATATLKNTVLANNSGGNCWSIGGTVTSHGYNLSDDTSCAGFLTSNDKNNVSAGLDSNGLQDNGGPTKTIALLPTSPAVDAVPIADCTLSDGTTPLATDQRGVTRPAGSACDIGAFELAESEYFSFFSAKLDIQRGSGFDLNSKFTLESSSNGIDPLTEAVKLQVGTYDVTIPAASFHQLKRGAKQGSWVSSGVIDGVSLSIQIVPLGGNSYQFKAEGSPVNLTALTNPVTVTLTIGDDTGTASVHADF
jgi:hypothetical protein